MLRERRHLQLHLREERQPGEQRMEFVIRLNVEEAKVRVFANDSVKSLPPPSRRSPCEYALSRRLEIFGLCGRQFAG